MEAEWSAFCHSKWESVLGNGRNTHLHLSREYRRAVTALEWMAVHRAWQKNTKCLTCATVVLLEQGGWGGGKPVANRTTTWHPSAPSLSKGSLQLASYSFHRIRATSLKRGGRWGFCFLVSSRSPLTSLCLFSVAISYAHQPPCRPTACQSKLLLTLSSPAQWHRSSPGMALSKMKNKKRKEMGLAVYTSPLSSVSSAVFMSFLFVFPALIFSLHATTGCQGILLTLSKTNRERKSMEDFYLLFWACLVYSLHIGRQASWQSCLGPGNASWLL